MLYDAIDHSKKSGSICLNASRTTILGDSRETDWYPWPCIPVHMRHRLANELGSDESVGCVEDPPGEQGSERHSKIGVHYTDWWGKIWKNEKILFIAEHVQNMHIMHYLRNLCRPVQCNCINMWLMWLKMAQELLLVQFPMSSGFDRE